MSVSLYQQNLGALTDVESSTRIPTKLGITLIIWMPLDVMGGGRRYRSWSGKLGSMHHSDNVCVTLRRKLQRIGESKALVRLAVV